MTTNFKDLFQQARNMRTVESVCVYVVTALLVLEFVVSKYFLATTVVSIIQVSTCIISVVMVILNLLSDLLLYQAEEDKRKDLLDNAFGSHLSEYDTNGYYNNELPKSINKLAVNNFESSFFTYRILKSGLAAQIAKILVVILVFLTVSLTAERDMVIFLFQLTLPVNSSVSFVRYCLTYNRVERIYNNYRTLFDNNQTPRHADLISNILSYSAALATGRTLLSEKRYTKLNDQLSKEWEGICKSLKIG